MNEDKFNIKITSDTRRTNGWVKGCADGGITFQAKVFDEPSIYGIHKGRISKMGIRKNNEHIANYDRGWDIKPDAEYRKVCKAIMNTLNSLGMASDIDNQRTLQARLEAAKEKAESGEYEVIITETLQMKITVTAISRDEAEQLVSDKWRDGDYVLDADHFTGVAFEAAPVKPERSRGEER